MKKWEVFRKLEEEKRQEIIKMCIAIANSHLTHVRCPDCKTPSEIESYWFTGFFKAACESCGEELDLKKLLNVDPDEKFMKWVAKRVPEDEYERVAPPPSPRQVEISSLLEGIERMGEEIKMPKCNKPKKQTYRLDARLDRNKRIEFELEEWNEEDGKETAD